MKKYIVVVLLALAIGCREKQRYVTIGHIEKLDASLDNIVASDAPIEIIADGFDWAEGPLWIDKDSMLLVSDVPGNTIYQWTEAKGKEVYLHPSGYTDTIKRGGETGSNGIILNHEGKLLLTQCGNRQIAWMDAPLHAPQPKFITVARQYDGKKFNSPNDLIVNTTGDIFFTDPPYGLEKNMDDPLKELSFQGVYKIKKNGEVILLTDTITRPNGILLSPNEKTLLVSNSDPDKPNWYAFTIAGDSLINGRIFYSAAGYDKKLKGLPDGMKKDSKGNLFATGPGGVWIFDRTGKLAGKILVPEATSNCALSTDEKTLYITNDMNVLRVKLRP